MSHPDPHLELARRNALLQGQGFEPTEAYSLAALSLESETHPEFYRVNPNLPVPGPRERSEDYEAFIAAAQQKGDDVPREP